MRDTDYAKELVPPAVLKYDDGHEARLERLQMKETGEVEIRLSWWKHGRLIPRPLDLPESDLLRLLAKGIRQGVLLPDSVDTASPCPNGIAPNPPKSKKGQ